MRNAAKSQNMVARAIAVITALSISAVAAAAGPPVTVAGRGFVVRDLKDGARAYGNRTYVWRDVPKRLAGWQFTQTCGGAGSAFTVKAAADGVIHVATAEAQGGIDLAGWTKLAGVSFWYTDRGRSRMAVYTRPCTAGQIVPIPQGNWSGGIVLAPSLAGKESAPAAPKQAARPDHSKTPGVVIDYIPAATRTYVGSPSIVILPDGSYAASHDIFGPRSTQKITRVFRSDDKGKTWRRQGRLDGQWWSGLFVHKGKLYIMGTSRSYGNVVIRRSEDGGKTWTVPRDARTGLLLTGSRYHTSSMPVVVHNGRLWRTMEDNTGRWGIGFRSFMMSAPVEADLLEAANWTASNRLGRDPKWLGGKFGGWLEGNAVVTPDGHVVNILRAHTASGGIAAMINVSPDGKVQTFDPKTGFITFPGGCKKFTIRYDPKTRLYYSLANAVLDRYRGKNNVERTRNVMALTSSPDLKKWTVRSIVLEHPDTHKVGFQYSDWQFDGDDLIVAIRMAHPDGVGGAHNQHDANYLAFLRVRNFRQLTGGDTGH